MHLIQPEVWIPVNGLAKVGLINEVDDYIFLFFQTAWNRKRLRPNKPLSHSSLIKELSGIS